MLSLLRLADCVKELASWVQWVNMKEGNLWRFEVFFLSNRVIAENTSLLLPKIYCSTDSFGVREKFLFHNGRERFSPIWTPLWNNYKFKLVVGPRIISHFKGCNIRILYLFLKLLHHRARFLKRIWRRHQIATLPVLA